MQHWWTAPVTRPRCGCCRFSSSCTSSIILIAPASRMRRAECLATWGSRIACLAWAWGWFVIGYLALQIPGSLLAENWSARRTIAGSMVVWGSLTALTALVYTPMQLYLGRFLLGLAEASFFPGVLVYLSHWFIQKDRAKAASNFMAAIPLSLMIGSRLAGWIVGHHRLGVGGRG